MKLLPCPFCGSGMSGRAEYEIEGDSYCGFVHAVVCSKCWARGPFTDPDEGKSEARSKSAARKLWNQRAGDKQASAK